MTVRVWTVIAAIAAQGCAARTVHPIGKPPADPLADVSSSQLFLSGRAFARAGDWARAEQYLGASLDKGAPESKVMPDLVRVCVAASRYRAALRWAEPYLERHPDDRPTRYVVAQIRLSLGDRAGAEAALGVLVRAEPPLPEAQLALAQLAAERDDRKTARAGVAAYLAARPDGRLAGEAKALLRQLAEPEHKRRRRR